MQIIGPSNVIEYFNQISLPSLHSNTITAVAKVNGKSNLALITIELLRNNGTN